MNLFDTHAHVNFNAYKDDGEDVLRRCLNDGMNVVNVGSQYSTSKRAVEYAHKLSGVRLRARSRTPDEQGGVWAAVGIHPVHLKKGSFTHHDPWELSEEPASSAGREIPTVGEQLDYQKYLELAKDEKVVAIGEIGLDYHHFVEEDDVEFLKNLQKETLIEFIKLANEVQKPVMLHCWDGYDDLLEILQTHSVDKKGIVHSFIGSYKTAQKFIELGYVIGLNGIITYGESYDRLIKEIDLKNIVIETDCPYLTPRPLEKGIRNEPLFVKEVAQKIADVKGATLEDVAQITSQNAKLILNLSS
ncbi:MAG: Mg-dependent DNase [Candidatus Moranbacteria bacterium GW2011_GWD2_36_12]|nr:MAG: Mg-dependent DNase [Candidatus Moranbacteria bacterium GW2011_GWD2_36_12]KKQ05414.1 MAG: Mg-dependent DNase [Candidatus Moranbacteria bacterium GW2011_GWE2_36_40]